MNQELDFGSIEWVRRFARTRAAARRQGQHSALTSSRPPRAALQVAYDFDFTIAHYNDSLGHTIYQLAKQHLVRLALDPRGT